MKNKVKKAFIIFLAITAALCLFACKKKNNDPDNSNNNNNNNPPAPQEEYTKAEFEKDLYVVEQYDTAELIVDEFSGKTVSYASSDEKVASVNGNGIVCALTEGRATITAICEKAKAECVVVVNKSSFVPTIELEQEFVSVDETEDYSMTVTAKFKNAVIEDDITYAVTLADGGNANIADVSVTGNRITVSGRAAGETDYYVSATVRGVYLNKKFTVKVISLGYNIKSDSDEITMTEDGYSMSFSAYKATDDDVTEKPLAFTVYNVRTPVEGAVISWRSLDETIAQVETRADGVYVVAKKGGKVTIVGEYNDGENTASVTVVCNIVKPIVTLTLDETPSISVYSVKNAPQANKLSIPVSKLTGGFTRVTFNGETASTGAEENGENVDITLTGDVFPKKTELLGANTIIVETDLLQYELSVNIYTLVINNAEELRSVKSISDELNGGGYYILGSDVELKKVADLGTAGTADWYYSNSNGIVANYSIGYEETRPFSGIFDGNGHVISGLSFNGNFNKIGFITYMGDSGVLKNVAFVNTGLQGQATVVSYGSGLIENVYVHVARRWVSGQYATGVFGVNYLPAKQNLKLNNVVVDFTDTVHYDANATGNGMLLGLYQSAAQLTNVAVLGVSNVWKNNVLKIGDSTDASGIYVYNSDERKANNAIPAANWGDCWTVNDGSLPIFKGVTVSTAATLDTFVESIFKGNSAQFKAGANCVISLGEAVDGITIDENGLVTVADTVAAGTTFTVLSKNIFDYKNPFVLEVTVIGDTVEREIDVNGTVLDLGAAVEDGAVAYKGTGTELNVSSVYSGDSEGAPITFNGTSVGRVDVVNGKFTVTPQNFTAFSGKGDLVATIFGSDGVTYAITLKNLLVVTKVINDTDGLRSVKTISNALNGGGYFVLNANITFNPSYYNGNANSTAEDWYCNSDKCSVDYTIGTIEVPFNGTIDGQGYTISGIDFNGADGKGFINYMGENGVLKNVAFVNTRLQGRSAIVYGAKAGGLVENVYVQLYSRWVGIDGRTGMFAANPDFDEKLVLKNVVVDLTDTIYNDNLTRKGLLLGRFASSDQLTNVVILGVTDAWKNDVAVNGETAYVSYLTGGDNGVTFPATGWDETYWTVSGTSVTWKTK